MQRARANFSILLLFDTSRRRRSRSIGGDDLTREIYRHIARSEVIPPLPVAISGKRGKRARDADFIIDVPRAARILEAAFMRALLRARPGIAPSSSGAWNKAAPPLPTTLSLLLRRQPRAGM